MLVAVSMDMQHVKLLQPNTPLLISGIVSDIHVAVFVLKRDVKLQLTNSLSPGVG